MTFDFCLPSVSDLARVLIRWSIQRLERDVINET